ncbi:diacylglycerol kinase family protein [Oceanicoccus sagamiensis]|uniref:diacylglycerol kinase family protein n=1 Tax=Oceanicoccus sagamiensis TaxID=716816 RepID=UPI00197F7E05|nr:diacylglycerol kinase family protein [Oceanicoccus sagamiensis]
MPKSKPEPFTLKSRFQSMGYALAGVADLLRHQHNARLHAVAALLVLMLAFLCSVQRWEWAVLLLAIGGVWLAEAINTAIEYLADACHPEQHPLIKRAKDVAAAAVLLFSLTALLVGLLVFVPYLALL